MLCRKELTEQAWNCYSLKILLRRLAPGSCLTMWISGDFCPLPNKNDSLCLYHLYSTNSMVNPFFLPGHILGRGCHVCDQSPVKTAGTDSLTSFSGWQHFTCIITTGSRGLKRCCVAPLGEDSASLPLVSSRPYPQYPSTWLTLLCIFSL